MPDRLLFFFSVAIILWSLAAMVVPYVRRQADLLTARNFFLLGAAFYLGFSGIKASQEGHYHPYSSKVFWIYSFYVVLFLATFEIAYRKMRWPSRVASRHFQQWPPLEGPGLWFPLALTSFAISLQVILVQVPGLAGLLRRTGMAAPAFALVFALAIWARGKLNPVAICAVITVFLLGAYLAFSIGGGRRFLYALAVAGPCCLYWWVLRYKNPWKTLATFAAMALLWPIGDSAYRAARWVGAKDAQDSVGAAGRWEIFKDALFQRSETFGQSALQIGQNTVENSLLTCYIFHEARGQFPTFRVEPLHSLYVIATMPIPRVYWEEKPSNFGITLPYDSRVVTARMGRTNWGPGIVAHVIHDGGIPVAIFYAVLIAWCLRYVDELLVRQPGNPFLIGFLSSASVQITGLIRGDLAAMAPLALLCFLFMLIVYWATRMVVGVAPTGAYLAGVPSNRRRFGGFSRTGKFLPREGVSP